jgi:ubiquinone/menaquinone biosynthesis C-methylase UbiE/uncharacterized protein YbaR (Trm112 family)
MQNKLLEILVCPKCHGSLDCRAEKVEVNGDIIEGALFCIDCKNEYQITSGIPRFVKVDNYASSFGYQWNLFRKEQIDFHNGTNLSAKRFWSETCWSKKALAGKWILDAGCGAGRFLDPASQSEAEVVGIDISNAIDAAKENLTGRRNVHFVQASIYELPFKDGAFDDCYCIGVIQHTPDPLKTLECLPRVVKENGEIAVTIYPNEKWYTLFYSKYLLRPFTKRMPKETLLKIIQTSMPVLFPLTSFLFRLPLIGKVFSFVIPVANYVDESSLSKEQRYNWALLDTFDMLSPEYDQPQNESEVREVWSNAGVKDIQRLSHSSLNLKGKRAANKFVDRFEQKT